MKITPPRYTQVPNELLDNLSGFSKTEIAILMSLCRLTFGYHRDEAVASNSQLAKMCGMATTTLVRNARSLEERGFITHGLNYKGVSVWSIVLTEETEVKEEKPKFPAKVTESVYDKAKKLAEITRMDFETNKGMLLSHAKKLPLTQEELIDIFGPGGTWYRYDFRGKMGSPPSLKQLSTEFLKLRQKEQESASSLDVPSESLLKNGELFIR